ncbi:hypothetical protein SDC9_187828 [bioreactor metagenome]|uniref:Uncharacterized protein n=1 Tax=bioreactor metagenome TaxID=1076179 RepID=A0A645HPA2_9ZZZZ
MVTSAEDDIILTMVVAIPKPIRATASSMAATLISMEVSGPFALNWLITMMVWAGAVAAAMAPSMMDSFWSNPQSISTVATSMIAPNASAQAMMMGAMPTFLK